MTGLLAALILGVGGAAVGLAGLLERPRQAGRRLPGAGAFVAVMLLVLSGGLALAGQPRIVWAAAAAPAGADLLARIVMRYSEPLLAFLRWMLGAGRLRAGALLILGPLVAVGWCYCFDAAEQDACPEKGLSSQVTPDFGLYPLSFTAATDGGQPIRLFAFAPKDEIDPEPIPAGYAQRIIRTAPPDKTSNCHGWVFTGGRYCLVGRDVELILRDNGYEQVSDPMAGDLVIYRDGGEIVHTGLVRATGDLTMVESKWSVGGRYLHAPADQGFGRSWAYYRTARASHVLKCDWPTPLSPEPPAPRSISTSAAQ